MPATADAHTNNVQRPWYNRNIRDSVALRESQGNATFIVEGDTVLSIGGTTYNDTLFSDGVHPNQTGYDRLGDEILRRMRGCLPPVLAVRKPE